MNKEQIIEAYGKQDGNDEHRYITAIEMAGLTDHPVSRCFKGLVNLESKGIIVLDKEKV